MKKWLFAISTIFLLAISANAQTSKDEFLKLVNEKRVDEASKLINQVEQAYPKDFDVLVAIGDVYSELEKYPEAVNFYAKAYDIHDDNQVLNRKYSLALADAKNFKEAFKLIRRTIKDNPKVIENYLTASEVFIRADSLSEAEIEIDRAREIDPKNPGPYVAMGNFYYARRVYELARQNYEEALKLDPKNTEAHFKLATSYYWLATRELDKDLANELYTRSLKEWNTLSQLDSMNAKAYFEQGKIWFFSDRYTEAINALSRYVKLRPQGSLGRWYLAQSLFKIGDCDNAIPNLEICAKEIDSVKMQAEQSLADCYISTKSWAKAKALYEEFQKEGVQFNYADYRKFGQAAFFTGDTASAFQYFQKSMDLNKEDNCVLMYFYGTLLNAAKQYAQSNNVLFTRLNTTACQDSLNGKIYYIIGTNFLFNSQPDSASVYLQKALQLDPTNIFADVFLGDAYVQMKDNKKGMDKYLEIITKSESNPEINKNAVIQAYAKYCNLLLDAKNFNLLNKYAKKWSEVSPDNPYGFLYLAVSYQGLGDRDNACRTYSKVLKIDPNNQAAKKNMEIMECGKSSPEESGTKGKKK
jgi:tetratricopeptide (TPR) repeat protein